MEHSRPARIDRHNQDQVEHFKVSLTLKYRLQCRLFYIDIYLHFTLDMFESVCIN